MQIPINDPLSQIAVTDVNNMPLDLHQMVCNIMIEILAIRFIDIEQRKQKLPKPGNENTDNQDQSVRLKEFFKDCFIGNPNQKHGGQKNERHQNTTTDCEKVELHQDGSPEML